MRLGSVEKLGTIYILPLIDGLSLDKYGLVLTKLVLVMLVSKQISGPLNQLLNQNIYSNLYTVVAQWFSW